MIPGMVGPAMISRRVGVTMVSSAIPFRQRSDRPMPDLTAADIIVHSLTASQAMLMRYTEDLKPEEYLHRTAPGANCAAWLLGHLVLSDRSVLGKRLNVGDLPTLPDGFEKAFSR